MARLAEATWPDLEGAAHLLVVPLGSTEQHGPHLPLGTDTVIASALADRLARGCPDVLVAPPLPFGSSGEHASFPGTLSIGQQALELVVVELVRSADDFAGVVLVNGHGGNREPLGRAIATLRAEGRRVLAWSPPPGLLSDAHAGAGETSILLALDAPAVRLERAAPGSTDPLERLLPALQAEGVRAVSPSGVLGDPTGASAEAGAVLLDALAADLAGAVAAWRDPSLNG